MAVESTSWNYLTCWVIRETLLVVYRCTVFGRSVRRTDDVCGRAVVTVGKIDARASCCARPRPSPPAGAVCALRRGDFA